MSWTWYQRTAVEAILYRTGRLEIEINLKFTDKAVVFNNKENKSEMITLATTGRFHRDGQVLGSKNYTDDEGAFDAAIEETDEAWIGYPYGERGYVKSEKVVLKKTEWEKYLEPGDPVVGLHIPPGGGMTEEKVNDAFAEAKEFLANCYPEFKYKAFKCESWLMDPMLAKILGDDSNIGKFVNRFTPICIKSGGRGVFNFVFLQPNPAAVVVENLPEETSLQRKIKQLYLDGGCIYEMYGYIPREKI